MQPRKYAHVMLFVLQFECLHFSAKLTGQASRQVVDASHTTLEVGVPQKYGLDV